MELNEQNYKKFIEYVEYAPLSMVADKLKVSEKTISRYKNKDTEISKHIILIIDLYEQQTKDSKTIDGLKFELSGIKQTIYDFKQSQKALYEIN